MSLISEIHQLISRLENLMERHHSGNVPGAVRQNLQDLHNSIGTEEAPVEPAAPLADQTPADNPPPVTQRSQDQTDTGQSGSDEAATSGDTPAGS